MAAGGRTPELQNTSSTASVESGVTDTHSDSSKLSLHFQCPQLTGPVGEKRVTVAAKLRTATGRRRSLRKGPTLSYPRGTINAWPNKTVGFGSAQAPTPQCCRPPGFISGVDTTRTIFDTRQQPMSLEELHLALDRVVRAWVAATCVWKSGWSLGEYRFVVFSIEVAPETEVYVQLWSEPLEPVLWEVSSGRWNPPADKWLAGERTHRISAFGFEIGGRADNFQRLVPIQSRSDLTSVSRTMVDILYLAFDYRGTAELNVHFGYQTRAELRPVLTSLTPEDLTKVLVASHYSLVSHNEDDDAPVLQFRARGVVTSVLFHDRVPDQYLFETAVLTCALPTVSSDTLRRRVRVATLDGITRLSTSRSAPRWCLLAE